MQFFVTIIIKFSKFCTSIVKSLLVVLPVPVIRVILPDRPPLSLREVGPPSLPVLGPGPILLQSPSLGGCHVAADQSCVPV